MTQSPDSWNVTTPPEIEQTLPLDELTEKVTVCPIELVAVGVYVPLGNGVDGAEEVKATVCVPLTTSMVNERVAEPYVEPVAVTV